MERLKRWAGAIRRDAHTLWLAARDRRTPWAIRTFALLVAAYALSPIDLIPDAIPVLGLLDEAILLPLAMWVLIRAMPAPLLAELRAQAEMTSARPISRAGAALVIGVWIAGAVLFIRWLWR